MNKKLLRTGIIILCALIVIFNCSCSDLKITEEMQNAIDVYTQAVALSETRQEGKVSFVSLTDDKALDFKKTETKVDFEYTVHDNAVSFTRTDFLNGAESAKYKSNGISVEKYDYNGNTWIDATEENKKLLKANENPFVTLSLFRVDNKL